MREMLRDMPAGVPADCLQARIRGRRSFLVRDWERRLLTRQPLATLSAAPWRQAPSGSKGWVQSALQQEFYWVFSRMDEQLRRSMAPFFWLTELRTLAVCLRLLAEDTMDLDHLLRYSLLANNIRKALRQAGGCVPALDRVAVILAVHDPHFAELGNIYRSEGSGAMEASLHEISLQSLARLPLHPQMRCYIELMIDSRNLITVVKRLRWRLNTLSTLLEGGHLALPRLAELFQRRDNAGLLHLAMRLGGQAPYGKSADTERVLYKAQGRVMQRLARQADGIGTILDYLWRCGNEATNIGLLERLETAGGEQVGAELRP